tara:strand:+ start:336 stop:803 length:468 start_codon:yes stop_codon:yes gene_type:complete
MTTQKPIELDAGMSFCGHPSHDETQPVVDFHNAVANLLFQEHLGKKCAVAIRRWYLENNCLHPEDSAPMGMLHNGDPAWSDFNDQTGGQGDDIDNLARAEWAQRMICRVLLEAERNSDIPLLDMIAAEAPDIDGSDGLSYLLDLATWRPAAKEEA